MKIEVKNKKQSEDNALENNDKVVKNSDFKKVKKPKAITNSFANIDSKDSKNKEKEEVSSMNFFKW